MGRPSCQVQHVQQEGHHEKGKKEKNKVSERRECEDKEMETGQKKASDRETEKVKVSWIRNSLIFGSFSSLGSWSTALEDFTETDKTENQSQGRISLGF